MTSREACSEEKVAFKQTLNQLFSLSTDYPVAVPPFLGGLDCGHKDRASFTYPETKVKYFTVAPGSLRNRSTSRKDTVELSFFCHAKGQWSCLFILFCVYHAIFDHHKATRLCNI